MLTQLVSKSVLDEQALRAIVSEQSLHQERLDHIARTAVPFCPYSLQDEMARHSRNLAQIFLDAHRRMSSVLEPESTDLPLGDSIPTSADSTKGKTFQ